MIEESVIKEVIERTDIVRLVGEYVPLKRRGANMWGCCPFHKEKTASFSVNADRGAYYCFGCHKGGHAIQFLMDIAGLTFPEAVEQLADRLGIEVLHSGGGKPSDARMQAKARKQSFYDVNRAALACFEAAFSQPGGAACRQYAQNRSLTAEAIANFHLGYAPDSWDETVRYLSGARVSLEDAVTLGLIAARENGGYYARFRNRLMFPVYNVHGEVIAFSGRALDSNETAKYINSPESDIYTKGEHLFGLYQARQHIQRERCAILVEGNVDVVMMHAYGFRHTVASLGTALTPKQVELLFRQTKTVYLMYDGDEAGHKSMMRAMPLLLDRDFEGLYVVELPPKDDPDSFLRAYGAAELQKLIAGAKPLGAWCVEKKCGQILSLAPELRKRAFGELGDLLHSFPDPLTQRHFLEAAARELGNIDLRRLAAETGMEIAPQGARQTQPANAKEPVKFNSIESVVVQMTLTSATRYRAFVDQHLIDLIEDEELRTLLEAYGKLPDTSEYAIESGMSPQALQIYHRLVCTPMEIPKEEDAKEQWYQAALSSLIFSWANRQHMQLAYEIADCIEQGNREALSEMLERDRGLLKLMEDSSKDRRFNRQTNG